MSPEVLAALEWSETGAEEAARLLSPDVTPFPHVHPHITFKAMKILARELRAAQKDAEIGRLAIATDRLHRVFANSMPPEIEKAHAPYKASHRALKAAIDAAIAGQGVQS